MPNLTCDKCSATINSGSKFCPSCADPVTDSDRSIEHTQYNIVCPNCEDQNIHDIYIHQHKSWFALLCPKCGNSFKSRIATTRSKRSALSRKGDRTSREFSIRIKNPDGTESLIEFANSSENDFELKSGDVVIFSYRNDHLRIIQNITLRRYMPVSNSACFIATCVFGENSPEVSTLRRWRDRKLIPSPIGALAVALYYKTSPKLVALMKDSSLCLAVARACLSTFIRFLLRGSKEKAT